MLLSGRLTHADVGLARRDRRLPGCGCRRVAGAAGSARGGAGAERLARAGTTQPRLVRERPRAARGRARRAWRTAARRGSWPSAARARARRRSRRSTAAADEREHLALARRQLLEHARPRAAAGAARSCATNASISRRVSRGASSASPPATTRTAVEQVGGLDVLEQEARTRRRAARRTRTRRARRSSARSAGAGSARSAVIRRVASRPSMRGIRMSISTMSGRCAAGELDRLRAVGRLGRRPRCPAGRPAAPGSPARTSAWSSASRTPDHDAPAPASGSVASTRQPPPAPGPASSVPPSASARSRMPRRPAPAPPGRAAARRAVVGDHDRAARRPSRAHDDAAPRGRPRGAARS